MNTNPALQDYLSLSPMAILLLSGLVLIVIESLSPKFSRKSAFPIAFLSIIAALISSYLAPEPTHPYISAFIVSDSPAQFFTSFFLVVGAVIALISASFFKQRTESHGEYAFLLLSSLIGLILIGASADFLTLFLGLEILSLALYVLVAYMKTWSKTHEAAIKFFLLGSMATAFLIFGVALIYGATGTTRFEGLLEKYGALTDAPSRVLFISGSALFALGLLFKAAVVPFHFWAPDVYAGAATPVTAFLAVGSKAGAFAGLARVFLITIPGFDPVFSTMIALAAAITLLYGNILAIRQRAFRRFFAYSGISHSGFMLIAIAAAGEGGAFEALAFYLTVYSVATLGVFSLFTAMDAGDGDIPFESVQGLFKRSPWIALAFALSLLVLAGFPPFVGFFAKFILFKVAYTKGLIWLMVLALILTVISSYYYFRLVLLLFKGAVDQVRIRPECSLSFAFACLAGVLLLILSLSPDRLTTLIGAIKP
ncbi:NADH-quinone oxidoreductase subunit N [Estrella lausannensis]|uniref:NADH-quinone oxidoreductase subunit N n=1 Tax=Estrella lausannensis TaxID=483423 RepID=A0A0H5E6P9_9BACT|nr:NADH-quinone oxidoreductase subunit N [Estrella lausannensis]CRX38955.1 NADH-quinone oxidoreductase subunit N [Estrella lausannensis]